MLNDTQAAMRATKKGDSVRYIGRSIAWLETGMVGVIEYQDSRDGHRDVAFSNGKAAVIRPYDLSSWEAL